MVDSFVYKAKRPLHPERFHAWTRTIPETVLRAKGVFWLANRYKVAGDFSLAGPQLSFTPAGWWWGVIDQSEWPDEIKQQAKEQNWVAPNYDRRQELVFIGIDMDKEAITNDLDNCLITDEEWELGIAGKLTFADPFSE